MHWRERTAKYLSQLSGACYNTTCTYLVHNNYISNHYISCFCPQYNSGCWRKWKISTRQPRLWLLHGRLLNQYNSVTTEYSIACLKVCHAGNPWHAYNCTTCYGLFKSTCVHFSAIKSIICRFWKVFDLLTSDTCYRMCRK